MSWNAGHVAVVVLDGEPAQVRRGVARRVHTIMHEYPIGEVLVHIFYADVVNALYAGLTFEDRDDVLQHRRWSRTDVA